MSAGAGWGWAVAVGVAARPSASVATNARITVRGWITGVVPPAGGNNTADRLVQCRKSPSKMGWPEKQNGRRPPPAAVQVKPSGLEGVDDRGLLGALLGGLRRVGRRGERVDDCRLLLARSRLARRRL